MGVWTVYEMADRRVPGAVFKYWAQGQGLQRGRGQFRVCPQLVGDRPVSLIFKCIIHAEHFFSFLVVFQITVETFKLLCTLNVLSFALLSRAVVSFQRHLSLISLLKVDSGLSASRLAFQTLVLSLLF